MAHESSSGLLMATLVGLLMVATTIAAEDDKTLEELIRRFQSAKARTSERSLEVARLLASRVGASRGYPVELGQIKQQVREQSLAWLEHYRLLPEGFKVREDIEAVLEAIPCANANLDHAKLARNPGLFPYAIMKVVDACGEFVSALGSEIFESKQLDTWLRQVSRLEPLMRRVARDDVAEFLLGWAQYHTCRTLHSANKKRLDKLYADGQALFIDGASERLLAKEPSCQQIADDTKPIKRKGGQELGTRSGPRKLVEYANEWESAMKQMGLYERQLVKFFTDRLFEHRQLKARVDEALELEPEPLLAFLQPFDSLGGDGDAEALLETIRHARPNLTRNELRSARKLAAVTKAVLEPACNAFPGWLIRMAYLMRRDFSMLHWPSISQRLATELDEAERNKVRSLLSEWANYRACRLLRLASQEELAEIFNSLFEVGCFGSFGGVCAKPHFKRTLAALKRRPQ